MSEKEKGCTPFGVSLFRTTEGKRVAIPLRCGKNSCPFCMTTKGRKAFARVMLRGAMSLDVPLAMTFTFRYTPGMEYSSKCWNRLRLSLKRKTGMESYFRAREFQSRGSRHEHVIAWCKEAPDGDELKKLTKSLAINAGYGWRTDAVRVSNLAGISAYAAKYVTKAAGGAYSPGERPFSFSRDFPKLESNWTWEGTYMTDSDLPADLRIVFDWCIIRMAGEGNAWEAFARLLTERSNDDGMA